jgi:propanol-preferring alcohol dehydrogenase
MSPIPSFPYEILWGERTIRSVANLTRTDGAEFFQLASQVPLRVAAEPLPLHQAEQGLALLKSGLARGALVLVMD